MDKPPIIEVEVVPETPGAGARAAPRSGGAPVHPLSAILLLAVDNLWMLEEWAVVTWIFTIPLSFVSVAVPTFFIQKLVNKDRFARAFGLALLLGTIAAVPTSVTGTPVGLALLAWTGLDRLLGKPASGRSR